MTSKFCPGDTVYIIENNIHVRPCRVIRISGGFATVAFSRESATRLHTDRLYATEEEAKKHIVREMMGDHGKYLYDRI